jgi:flagellar hook-associated protein 2
MATGTITSTGIGSGLDVDSIVTKLMSIEDQPIALLEKATTTVQTQLSAFGQLQSTLATFRDAAQKLTTADAWTPTTSTSSDPTSVSVTSGTAAAGTYSIGVSQLATAQSNASGVFATGAALGTGTLHIELGQWDATNTGFTAKTGVTALDVTIGTGEDSLSNVVSKINAANAGVSASLVTDVNGSRIVVRSTATGKENGFRLTSTGAPGSGLASLSYQGTTGTGNMSLTQASKNALATVNGLAIESDSNTLSGAVQGLSIKLSKVTTAPIDVTVEQDNTTMKATVQSFVDAYNKLSNLLATDTKYDDSTKTAGPLQGDRTAVSLQAQFRQLVGGTTGASSVFSRLSDVGLEMQKDGTLLVNATKLDSALDNVGELKKMFSNADTSDPAVPGNDGFATRLRKLGDAVLGTDGAITTRSSGLQAQIDRNNKRHDELEARSAATETRIRAQYQALDTQLATLNSLSTYMTSQLTALAKDS